MKLPKQNMLKQNSNDAFTITFGDQAENHVGMEKFGKLADVGFNLQDLSKAKETFEQLGVKCELIKLNDAATVDADEAYILIVRNGIDFLLKDIKKTIKDLYQELDELDWDKKYFAYGTVRNKRARYNLCFGKDAQEPDYENKKGRVIAISSIKCLEVIMIKLSDFLGEKSKNLVAEGNRYYNVNECGIGFHGDGERKKVIGLRIGAKFPLHYQWFINGNAIGEKVELDLNGGDFYVMSEKATGFDWKKKKIATLRHAAGCKKYTTIKVKKRKLNDDGDKNQNKKVKLK